MYRNHAGVSFSAPFYRRGTAVRATYCLNSVNSCKNRKQFKNGNTPDERRNPVYLTTLLVAKNIESSDDYEMKRNSLGLI